MKKLFGGIYEMGCSGVNPLPAPTAIELSNPAGRNRSSPSPHEARTGRGLGRGVSELGQQPSSPRPSPPLVYVFSVVGTSRCDVRAACSGATTSIAGVAWIFVPPATTRAGTAQRAIPTIALNTYRWERAGVRGFQFIRQR